MGNELKSTPLKIADYIKEQIESKQLKIGEKIPSERDMVKSFNVSRSSIRESIKQLITMGYLKSVKRQGTFVSDDYLNTAYTNTELNKAFKMSPIFDLMEVRMLLEEKFIRLAMKRITQSDLEKLRNISNKINACDEKDETFLKLDLEFHIALAESTHNDIIIEIMKVIIKIIHKNEEVFKNAGLHTKEATATVFEKIVDSLFIGDVNTAEKLYQSHIHLVDGVLKEQSLN